ncbi:MAG: VOC family protein [Prosthecobacter sp.]|nr:VOC family protein [Prosthecobacter sp.]
MKTSYIPKGFHTVTPYLIVSDAERLVQFLRDVFDVQEVILMKNPAGKIQHAAFRIGDSMVELANGHGEWAPMTAALHVYVPDTDATYARAIRAGGTSLHEPKDMFYGERSGGVKDAFGNHWYIATQTEELSDEEIRQRAAKECA